MFSALGLALLAFPASGHDLGESVRFSGRPIVFESARESERVTGPSDPLAPFDMVLLQGRADDPSFSLSVSVETAGRWGGWIPAQVSRYPNGRFWAKAETGRSGGRVRLRAAGPGLASLQIFGVEAAPNEGERLSSGPQGLPKSGGSVEAPPSVHRRPEWQAKPPIVPFVPDEPYRLTIHHTEGARPSAWDDSITEMKVIQDFHQRGRGWNDIGYHFVIDGAGRVFEARPQTVVGAHTLSNNDGNIGVAFMGNMMDGDPAPQQLEAFVGLARFLMKRYGISAGILRGHRDYKATDCPGDRLYALIPKLKEALSTTPAEPPPAIFLLPIPPPSPPAIP